MFLATFDDATYFLVPSVLGIAVALALSGFLLTRVARASRLAVRILCGATAILVSGVALWIGGFFLLYGLAAWGCAPDAYECPT
jgi:hypothetical protein